MPLPLHHRRRYILLQRRKNRRCSRCWKIDSILQVDKNAVFYRPLSLINDTPLSARSWTPISDNMIVDGDQLKGNFSVINKTGGTQKVEISFKLVRRYLSKFDYMYSIILEDTWQQKIPDGYATPKHVAKAAWLSLHARPILRLRHERRRCLSPPYRLQLAEDGHAHRITASSFRLNAENKTQNRACNLVMAAACPLIAVSTTKKAAFVEVSIGGG